MAKTRPEVSELGGQNIGFLFGTMMDLRMLPTELKHTGKVEVGEFAMVAHFPSSHAQNNTEQQYLARHKTFRGGLYATYQDGPYKIDEIKWDATNRAGVHMVTKTKYGAIVEFPTQPSKSMPGSMKLMVQEYVESLKTPSLVIRCSGLGGALEPIKGKKDEYEVVLLNGDIKCPKKLHSHVPAKYHAEDDGRFNAQIGPWSFNAEEIIDGDNRHYLETTGRRQVTQVQRFDIVVDVDWETYKKADTKYRQEIEQWAEQEIEEWMDHNLDEALENEEEDGGWEEEFYPSDGSDEITVIFNWQLDDKTEVGDVDYEDKEYWEYGAEFNAYSDPITQRQKWKINDLGGTVKNNMNRSQASDYIKDLMGVPSGTWRAEDYSADGDIGVLNKSGTRRRTTTEMEDYYFEVDFKWKTLQPLNPKYEAEFEKWAHNWCNDSLEDEFEEMIHQKPKGVLQDSFYPRDGSTEIDVEFEYEVLMFDIISPKPDYETYEEWEYDAEVMWEDKDWVSVKDNTVADVIADEYIDMGEDYDDADDYARRAAKKMSAETFAARSTAPANLSREKTNVKNAVSANYGSFKWGDCTWGPHFLRLTDESSNKFYSVWVWERSPGVYTAMGAYGGLGQNPRLFNITQTADLQRAINDAQKKMNQKQNKGYQTY